ncbi:MAG TPA: hypothetical protein VFA94_14785 [Acidimicrobiales bacterium]|nr:hypothetical protein [Acidimicrobiales bacterium]
MLGACVQGQSSCLPLDPGWPWWMVAAVVVGWLAAVALTVGLFLRTRRARAARRAAAGRRTNPGAGWDIEPVRHGQDVERY